jgi:serine/threonine protein kinase/WD40 repeat protein
MAAQPDKVASIFDAAVELEDPAQRAAYLNAACGPDQQLRAAVEDLLRHDDAAGSFLSPATPFAAAQEPSVREGPGTVIGPYMLMEQIGEGGMGLVFVAEQHQPIRRKVALKVIKPGMDSRQVVARFEAERQALALMDHPNIAKVFDGGTTPSSRPYFVMELVRGVPITQFCDDNRLTPRQRLELFVSVCQAVQHAHQKGIIHRDVKPANVLVTLHDGTPVVKVIDFGVAKAIGGQVTDKSVYTRFNQMVGTPMYMSPEQAGMSGLDIDTRTDVYALGVLLYELLTGTTPFDKQRLHTAAYDEMCRIIREEEPPKPSTRLSTLGAALPTVSAQRRTDPRRLSQLVRGELDWIAMKALEKDRNCRYESASAFAADVQRYLHDEPVLACPPSVWYRLRKFLRRNKRPALAAAVVALALVGGILGTTLGMIRAVGEAKQKEAALGAARLSEGDAKDQLFLALWNQARAGRFSRQPGQRLDSLAALARAAQIRPDEQLRDEAIAALALPDVRRMPGRHSAPPGTRALAYGRQGRLYARADAQGTISVRSIPDDQEVRRIAAGPVAAGLDFSPDDRFLLAQGDAGTLQVWRVADGQPALRDELRECQAHAFSPNGQLLAVSRQGEVLCFDLATGQKVKRWRLGLGVASALAFHPDGRKLAVGYALSASVSVYDAASGALVTELPVGMMQGQVVAWHPDGARLAVASSDPRIQIWNVAAKRQVAILEGHVRQVTALTFHPDGDLLASVSWDGLLLLWDPSSGRQLLRLTPGGVPHFSADGRWLVVSRDGDKADLLEVTPCREYRTLVSSAGAGEWRYGYGAISPDGRMLAQGMVEGTRLWDLRSGRELAALPWGTTHVFFEGTEVGVGPATRAGPGGAGPARLAGPTTPASPPWSLLTSSPDGLLRWPVTSNDPEEKHLRLGPPRQVSPLHRAWFTHTPNGRTLAVATEDGGANQILDLETGTVRRELGVHPHGEVCALSADGRWAASCGWSSDRVRLWDIATGQVANEWAVGNRTFVFFTPDSRALVISREDEFSFWDVETLQPVQRLRREVTQYPSWVAFSPDGRLMALEMAPAVIHLKEVASGRTVARLEDPFGDRATWQGFTPDGRQLVVLANYSSAVHIWDLQAIRERLKAINLDWDWLAFLPAATGSPGAGPVTVEVLPGPRGYTVPPPRLPFQYAQYAVTRERGARQAIERGRREVEANPDSAKACNALAWAYLTAPEALREVQAAVPLAEKAVRADSENTLYRTTQGLSYYRAGRYREAVEVLRPSLDREGDADMAFALYFLAMSYHRVGETARARDYYDWAVRWSRTQRGRSADDTGALLEFRAEAEELLGIKSGK